jgi:hypothetical protein
MNNFRHIFFSFLLLVGLAVGVSAQRGNDPKKPPPKGESPKVEPREKPPRQNPKGDEKPKKPGSGFAFVSRIEDKYLA